MHTEFQRNTCLRRKRINKNYASPQSGELANNDFSTKPKQPANRIFRLPILQSRRNYTRLSQNKMENLMIQCSECKKELTPTNHITHDGLEFCGNLCRVLYYKKSRLSSEIIPDKKKRAPIKKNVVFAAISIAAFTLIGSFCGNYIVKYFKNRTPTDAELNAFASQVNTSLPMMLDNATQLKSLVAINGAINYYYVLVNLSKSDIDTIALGKFVTSNSMPLACGNPDSRSLLKRGVDFKYIYHDKSSQYVCTLFLDSQKCDEISPVSN